VAFHAVTLVGYQYLQTDNDCHNAQCREDVVHAVGIDAGLDFTYWFAQHFGLTVRVMADAVIPARSIRTERIKGVEQETAGPDGPLFGYTVALGVAF